MPNQQFGPEEIENSIQVLEMDLARLREKLSDWSSHSGRMNGASKKTRQLARTIVIDARRIEALVKESTDETSW